MNHRTVSSHFPYIVLEVRLGGLEMSVEVLLDTGFDGDVILPVAMLPADEPVRRYTQWFVADGSAVSTATFAGEVRLSGVTVSSIDVLFLGDEYLVGRGVTDHFTVILDHGRQVIVEP